MRDLRREREYLSIADLAGSFFIGVHRLGFTHADDPVRAAVKTPARSELVVSKRSAAVTNKNIGSSARKRGSTC